MYVSAAAAIPIFSNDKVRRMLSQFMKFFAASPNVRKPKFLVLIRHAEAKAADFNGEDISRELTDAGKAKAEALGLWLDQVCDEEIKTVLVSPATRALQTFMAVSHNSKCVPDVWQTEPELYETSISGYQGLIEQSQTDSLLIIGHNPMIGALAAELKGGTDAEKLDLMTLSPGSCCIFERSESAGPEWILKNL